MKVSWDDEIPNIWKNKIHVPNHQPGMLNFYKPGRNSVVLLGCDSQLSWEHVKSVHESLNESCQAFTDVFFGLTENGLMWVKQGKTIID